MKRLIATLVACAALVLSPLVASADIPLQTASGTLTGTSSKVQLTQLVGQSSCYAYVSGTFVGTWQLQVSADGLNWVAVTAAGPGGSPSAATSFTSPATVVANCASAIYAQVVFSAYTSGSASVILVSSSGVPPSTSSGGGGGTSNVNVQQFGGASVGAATAAGTSATGNIIAVQGVTGGVPQPIVQNSVPATATLDNTTIGASVVYALPQGSAAVGVQLVTSGSVSSASVQCSIDGVNYTNIPIYSLTAAGIVQTITSSPFYGIVPTAGCMDVDVVTNNVGGGTSAITFFNAPATNLTSFISSLPSGSNTIGNVGLFADRVTPIRDRPRQRAQSLFKGTTVLAGRV